MASAETQSLKGPGLASALAAAVAYASGNAPLGAFLTTFATSYALQAWSMREARKRSLEDATERKVMIRSAVAPHRIIYGVVNVAGAVVYSQVTGSQKEHLHLVMTLAGHQVHGFGHVWIDEERTERDGSGQVLGGPFAGLARLKLATGTTSQPADADLVTESAGKWTSAHQLKGIAYLYARLAFDQDKFPAGVPNLRVNVRGRLCYDPRDGATRLANNVALVVRDYLTAEFGLGASSAEIDDDAVITAANVCDEWVALDGSVGMSVTAASPNFTVASVESRANTGDRVVLNATTVPGGLSNGGTYYLIRLDATTFRLAATFQDALEHAYLTFSSAGSGVTFNSIAQKRYTANGAFSLDQTPKDVLEELVAAMAGTLTWSGGLWRMSAGAYVAPAQTITESDLRGPVTMQPRRPRAELFNQVRGQYVDPSHGWILTDYAPVRSAAYVTQDGGEVIERELNQPFCDNAFRAQRIAKIVLRKSRAARLQMPLKIRKLALTTADTVAVTHAQLGLSGAVYRVVGWTLTGADGGIGVDVVLEAESSGDYDWSASEGVVPPINTGVSAGAPRLVAAPTSLTLAAGNAELLRLGDGTVLSQLKASWVGSAEQITQYEIQWKLSTESTYNSAFVPAGTTTYFITPVQDLATYDVRVRAWRDQQRSSFATGSKLIEGKTAAPAAPTSLTVFPALGGFDIAVSASPDADYAETILLEAASNDRGLATEVWRGRGTRFARAGLGSSVTRYYWSQFADTSGNPSAYYPASATAGVAATTSAAQGGVPTVANAAAITAGTGSPPPGGEAYWAVYDNTTGKIWRWSSVAGAYTKAADGGDLAAASVAADKIAVATLSAIQANTGTLLVDATGHIRGGASGYMSGAGFWMGYHAGAYKMHLGDPAGIYMVWDGASLLINGNAAGGGLGLLNASVGSGTSQYATGAGIWFGFDAGAWKFRAGDPAGAHVKWDGSALTIKGSLLTGDIQVDASGNIRLGAAGYMTGTGIWMGYTGGLYKLHIGNPAGNFLSWDGSTLAVVGTVSDLTPYGAGNNLLAAADTTRTVTSADGLKKVKEIMVAKGGTVRVTYTVNAPSAGGAGSTTSARLYKNGAPTTPAGGGADIIDEVAWGGSASAVSHDITVSAGDLVQLYVQMTGGSFPQGSVTLFRVKANNYKNEVVYLD